MSLERFSGAAFERLFTAAESRALDRLASERCGIPGIVLMKRAGRAAWATLERRWPEADAITVVCGRGNNAGDGYILAGCALSSGVAVQLIQLGTATALAGDAARARDWACALGLTIVAVDGEYPQFDVAGSVLVDALLGTGLAGPVRPGFSRAIELMRRSGVPVLALDIPSGLCSDTGRVLGAAVRAEITVSFIGVKRGLVTGRGPDHTGAIVLDTLDVPAACGAAIGGVPALQWVGQRHLIPRRAATAYKHQSGHLLVVGGDSGMGGAVTMAAEAALRVGAGLVSVVTRPEHAAAVLARRPEIMVHGANDALGIDALLDRVDVIAIGPGLGRRDWGRALFERIIEAGKPLVVDADGLLQLAECLGTRPNIQVPSLIVTPHTAEAAALLGSSVASVSNDRFAAAASLAARVHGIAVLKGAGTVVAGREQLGVCLHGNSGMASAGMGDVLTGVIASLLAQGLSTSDAASAGVCLHSFAADRAARRDGVHGLLATDLLPELRAILNDHAD